jgi:hypothetical protein
MTDNANVSKEAGTAAPDTRARSPTYAVMQVDDKAVTAIRFERAEKNGAPAYSVSYMIGNKSVMRLKELDAKQLVDAVGERNAKAIADHEQPKGTLKGESLINEQGYSPEAKARTAAGPVLEAGVGERDADYLVRTYKGFGKGEHDAQHDSLEAALRAFARADRTTIPRVVHGDLVVLELDPEDRGLISSDKDIEAAYWRVEKEMAQEAREHTSGREAADEERNIVEPVRDKDLEVMGETEVAARAAELRLERDKLEREQSELADLGQRAEAKRIGVENLAEKAREQDQVNDLAEKTGAPSDRRDQLLTEREKNRQIELMELVHKQFRVSGAKYHFKDQPTKVAFKDQGNRMVSGSNDDRVAQAMATMAEAKGWKTIKVSGHPDYVREVWMEASVRGLEVHGYKPTEQDKEQLEARRDRAMRNTVEHAPQRERKAADRNADAERPHTPQERGQEAGRVDAQGEHDKAATGPQRAFAGRLVEHGPAPYQHAPKGHASYYVKLATDKGERTVWGVDLKRAIGASKAKAGEDITLEYKGNQLVTVQAAKRDGDGRVVGQQEIAANRNTWKVQKSDRHKIAEAVASALIDARVPDQAQRDALKEAVGARLAERDRVGKVPAVPVYDRAAPSRAQERTGPMVERNAERTRSR